MRGEREELLNDVLQAIKEFKKTRRTKRNQRTELDVSLQQAGKVIRNDSVLRGPSSLVTDTRALDEEGKIIEASASARRFRRAQAIRAIFSSAEAEDEEDRTLLKNHTAKHKKVENMPVTIAEEQLKFQQKSLEH